jgi:hypothetical protein
MGSSRQAADQNNLSVRFEFMIAEGFPADDPLAQFVTVAAMISNDWQRLVTSLDNAEGADQVGQKLLGYRMQAALLYEAAQFLREALEIPGVEEFVAGLPTPARNDFDFVLAGLHRDPEVGHGVWFEQNRNRTFHYSRLGPRAPIAGALRRAGPESGAVDWGRTVGQTRFHFADQVALEWLPPAEQQEGRLTRMSESHAGARPPSRPSGVTDHVRERSRARPVLASRALPLRTSTGSLVHGADTAAPLLAAAVSMANGGGDGVGSSRLGLLT